MDFGDTRLGDHVELAEDRALTRIERKARRWAAERDELEEDLGPNAEYEAASDVWGEILGDILQDLERLEGELLAMREESQELEKAGMYPAIPSESWQPRSGKGSYLRMIFPRGTPGVPRKLYVGNKPEAVIEARRLAARRRRWEELAQAINHLERFLHYIRVNLTGVAERATRYQTPEEIASSLRSSQ